jgi:DNA-binding transcriptional LysR family regulator
MQDKLEMLRIFSVASKCANFKEASSQLGTSPQTITRAIKGLELVLGEPLFKRNTRSNEITDFGKRLAIKSRKLVRQFDSLLKADS